MLHFINVKDSPIKCNQSKITQFNKIIPLCKFCHTYGQMPFSTTLPLDFEFSSIVLSQQIHYIHSHNSPGEGYKVFRNNEGNEDLEKYAVP